MDDLAKILRDSRGDLTTGDLRSHLIRLSVPMIWGILAIVSFQLVDTYYISLLGTQALAAISFTFPVTMTVFSLIIGLGIGMSSVLSRRIGARQYQDVRRIATHGIILAAMIASTIALLGYFSIDPLFRAMGADEELMPMIRDYMTIWFLGVPFITIPVVGNSAIRATGDTLAPSITMMLAAISNAIIAPFLVFGLAGFPRLEVQGAAIATVLSYFLALGLGLYILYARKKMIFQGRFEGHLFGSSARAVLMVGLPAGIASLIQPLSQGIMTSIMARTGPEAVAAFGVATRVEAMAFVIIMALATGLSPILGQNHGAGRADRVREGLRLALVFCAGWSVFVALALGLFARPIAGLFSDDPGVVNVAILYFMIVPFSYAFGNLVQGWSSALNAMGQPGKAVSMILVRTIVLQVPLALLAAHSFGATGVFVSIALVNLATGLFYHTRHWRALPGATAGS